MATAASVSTDQSARTGTECTWLGLRLGLGLGLGLGLRLDPNPNPNRVHLAAGECVLSRVADGWLTGVRSE